MKNVIIRRNASELKMETELIITYSIGVIIAWFMGFLVGRLYQKFGMKTKEDT